MLQCPGQSARAGPFQDGGFDGPTALRPPRRRVLMAPDPEITAVEVVRFGGRSALREVRRTDGDALDAAERRALAALLQDGPPRTWRVLGGFRCAVTVSLADGVRRRVEFPEAAMPAALRGLLP